MADTNTRTDAARDHDDSEMIERTPDAPDAAGRAGGNLQRDVSTQSELNRVGDPEHRERVNKQDDIDNNDAARRDRPRG